VATSEGFFAFINDDGDEKATAALEIVEQTNADLRARHKSASLVATQEFSPSALRVAITAQSQEEADALQETLIAKVNTRLTDSGLSRRKNDSVKSMILKLLKDNPGRDYTAREVACEIGKKPHNISAVMRSLVQEGALEPTKKRQQGRFGTAPMAYKRT